MSKSLKEVVYDSDKQVGNARNALAKLFRTILLERRICHQNVDHYLQRYLNDPNNHISKNSNYDKTDTLVDFIAKCIT